MSDALAPLALMAITGWLTFRPEADLACASYLDLRVYWIPGSERKLLSPKSQTLGTGLKNFIFIFWGDADVFFVSFLASFRLNFIMVWAVSTIAELVLHNCFQKGNEVLWVKRRNWSKWYFPIAAKFKKLNKAKVYMIEFALRAGGFVETKPACCNIAFPVSFLQPTKPNRANQKWEKQGERWPDDFFICNEINWAFL